MKLTVKNSIRALNARTGRPETAAPNPYYQLPGNLLDIESVVVGSVVEGNAIWYRCAADEHYYWSGGFTEQQFVLNDTHLHQFSEADQVLILVSLLNALRGALSEQVAGYRGVGLGDKNNDSNRGLALNVYVDAKDSDAARVPRFFEFCGIRIPTDVKESGESVRYNWDGGPPFQPGGSIGRHGLGKTGTRTLKVKGKDGNPYVLTCCHVLFPDRRESYAYKRQPGELLHAEFPRINSARLINGIIEEGSYNSEYDFAVAQIADKDAAEFKNLLGAAGKPVLDFCTEMELLGFKGEHIMMFGNINARGYGTITDPDATRRIDGDNFDTSGLIVSTNMSAPGDSGAPVVINYGEGYKLIGYVVGGSNPKSSKPADETLILPFYKINNTKKYKIHK